MRPLTRLPISSDVGDVSADVRRLFDELARQRPDRRHQVTGECLPLLDVYETQDSLDLVLDVPGVEAAHLRILVKGSIDVAAPNASGLRRASAYQPVVERLTAELHTAAINHDQARLAELTRHLNSLLERGMAPHLDAARVDTRPDTQDYRELTDLQRATYERLEALEAVTTPVSTGGAVRDEMERLRGLREQRVRGAEPRKE